MCRHDTSPMILVFDTETTGLPPRNVPPSDAVAWNACRVVQIAWEVYDATSKELIARQQYVIKPDGFDIPDRAAEIHGITTQMAHDQGICIKDALTHLRDAITNHSVHTLVAHNMQFDDNVVMSEIMRCEFDELAATWSQMSKVCTMKMGTLPRQKWPKLSELYVRLFEREPDVTLHRADADVHVCAQCFFQLTS